MGWYRFGIRIVISLLACFGLSHFSSAAIALELSLPVACEIQKTCFVQNYVDVDASDARRDFACGAATYDGHKGTDFRLISTPETQNNVAVLAAAPGKIKNVRDGMSDRLVNKATASIVAGRECGNGVVIDHGDGWETQYCHLKRASVAVKRGDVVARGEQLGVIGFSGRAQFAHVHLEVRHQGRVIDPFTAEEPNRGCDRGVMVDTGKALWTPQIRSALRYQTGQIIEVGFSGVVPKRPQAETGLSVLPMPKANSKALLFIVRGINFRKGDRVQMSINGPGQFQLKRTKSVPRARATAAFYIGKSLKNKRRWQAGRYKAQAVVLRDGKAIDKKSLDLVIN